MVALTVATTIYYLPLLLNSQFVTFINSRIEKGIDYTSVLNLSMAVLKYGVTGEMLFVAQNYVYKIDQLFNYMHSSLIPKCLLCPLMVEESNSIVK